MLRPEPEKEGVVAVGLHPPRRRRLALPEEPGRRAAAWSLLMPAVTVAALAVAAVVGTLLQVVVFDLEEQESIGDAGALGYLAGFALLALVALPSVTGIVLGVRARRLDQRRRGTTSAVVNALLAAYLAVPAVAYLLFG